MTKTRTFTIWFNVYLDTSLVDLAQDSARARAAEQAAEALHHEFSEDDDTREVRDFGYTAPLTAAAEVFQALQERGALSSNMIWIDEDTPQGERETFESIATKYGLAVAER
jgi:hypothetical protein